ncbi:uncharacterized protein FIBRA_05557 [Fibroporia radiculosa]|uniref:Methyltransferase domain-containing protein n=1 Tax=Fibroporia radiculosa TaxID=599839 RepID=J4IAS6_9APHY|nr:uncharacterized protein FIBRA_05557 [Fibroporia radiculosa]CCM03426.1 predicted protein [Fibroporia radiculosa]
MADIRAEAAIDPALIPPLDLALFTPTDAELVFLRKAISTDYEEIRRRVIEVQKEAYTKYPYPCIRAFHHVSLMMTANPIYQTVLNASKLGETLLLDLGCCMGTDVRKLVQDGYPASHILGCDLRQDFIDLGFKLYSDGETCPIHFFTSDIFNCPVEFEFGRDPSAITPGARITELAQLTGSLTHIYVGALFHLFDESTQYAIALRLASLLKRRSGAVIFGRHRGLEQEGMIDDHLGRIRYGHSERSWPVMWRKVFGEAEGDEFATSRVLVEAKINDFDHTIFGTRRQGKMLVWHVIIL